MKNKTEKLLEALIDQIEDGAEFEKVQEALKKRGIQSLLKAELSGHLGYLEGDPPLGTNKRNGYSAKTLKSQDGEMRIKIPRDREGSFDPVIVPKHKSISQKLTDCVMLLYAKGMSNADIIDFMDHSYGVKYSTSQVSIITNSLLEDIRAWQQRPLEDQYAVLWIDAIHYKIRHDNKVISKGCMLVLGIDMSGKQDILSMSIIENESATAWSGILDDLRSRGVKDVLFLCSDNLTGLDKAVQASFPKSVHQICIVHQIRNSLKYVSFKDRKAIIKDIKAIYQASNPEIAMEAFQSFKEKWISKYPLAVNSWGKNWDKLTAFLNFPLEIRKLIYTTNIIESFNASLRKYTKNKKVFPTDDAAIKSVYLAIMQISKKWKKTRYGWPTIYNQLYLYFEDRIL
jgi:transposase-like protein